MQVELATEFKLLWDAGNRPPDVFAFLSQHPTSDVSEVLQVLLLDQELRWQTTQPLKVEDYLVRLSHLIADPSAKLQLVIGEYQVRQNSGTLPNIDEFTSRFADLGDSLKSRLTAVSGTLDTSVQSGTSGVLDGRGIRTITYDTDPTLADQRLGRYRLVRLLGEGGFGRVWLAQDEELQRYVAIKVPTPERFKKPEDAEGYLAEARTVATLDHPNIVPVFDVGRAEDGSVYVVSKFIEGSDLAGRIAQRRFSFDEAAQLLATIAGALDHPHRKRIIHRDIKPANILIEGDSGTPYIADFGLAMREEDFGKGVAFAGTPAYMSPEQARGEGHRLDGRSDIFALGAVFYQLLTGKTPFRGSTLSEVLRQVVSVSPVAPREIDDSIPSELERICFKALSKRASDRYDTVLDLASDLQHYLQDVRQAEHASRPPSKASASLESQTIGRDSSTGAVTIVPKGLRSFDSRDADFFLSLLPGSRDRHGMPEVVRFWKHQIEADGKDDPFSVGLLYGPSGCGKSSLVKAGLLPHLDRRISTVFVEATAFETERRLIGAIGARTAEDPVSEERDLAAILARIRRGELLPNGQKLLIVVDQFEQWLHANRALEHCELVQALRQCDGRRIQCLILVRDDFWMAVTHLVRELEVDLSTGSNVAPVHLFNCQHARRVLTLFGRAYGALPAYPEALLADQQSFIDRAVEELADEDQVICVHLALFAEMVKDKPWTVESLEQLGGAKGVGVKYLEETFSSRSANPKHRIHEKAAKSVMAALLPERGSDIKGNMRSYEELLQASGYAERPRDFEELLRILDSEVRLLTPTDSEAVGEFEQQSEEEGPAARFYHLTHDYLVPSLREWLTQAAKETWQGRARLRLAERTSLWSENRERRQLPSLPEWVTIRTGTRRAEWTQVQENMMRAGGQYFLTRGLLSVALLAVFLWGALDGYGRFRAAALVDSLLAAETHDVPGVVEKLAAYRKWSDGQLTSLVGGLDEDSKQRLHIGLALLDVDPAQADFLQQRLLSLELTNLDVVIDALGDHRERVASPLWNVLEDTTQADNARFRAACALAQLEAGGDVSPTRWKPVADYLVDRLIAELLDKADIYPTLAPLLQPIRDALQPALLQYYGKLHADESQSNATKLLADYYQDEPAQLVKLLVQGKETQFRVMYQRLESHRDAAIPLLKAYLDPPEQTAWPDLPKDTQWTEPTKEIVQRLEAAGGIVADRFAYCQDLPLDQLDATAEALRPSGFRPTKVRPFFTSQGIRVAALWKRDGKDWKLSQKLTAAQVKEEAERTGKEGYLPTDIAGYPVVDGDQQSEQYLILFDAAKEEGEVARVYAGLTKEEHGEEWKKLSDEFLDPQTVCEVLDSEGQARFCGIWRSAVTNWTFDTIEGTHHWSRAQNDLEKTRIDLRVIALPATDVVGEREQKGKDQLEKAETKLKENPDDVAALSSRASAHFSLENDEAALSDFDQLLVKKPDEYFRHSHRATSLSRLGRKDEAIAAMEAYFTGMSQPPSAISRLAFELPIRARLGENISSLLAQCEREIAAVPNDENARYSAASMFSSLAAIYAESDQGRAAAFRRRAIGLLPKSPGVGFAFRLHSIKTGSNFDALRTEPEFKKLLSRMTIDQRFTSVWWSGGKPDVETVIVRGLPKEDHLDRCRELVEQGFRPGSVTACESKSSGQVAVSSIWHRPQREESQLTDSAARMGSAAAALSAMGQLNEVLPSLFDVSNVGVQSRFIERSTWSRISPGELTTRIQNEESILLLRPLLLALGNAVEDGFLTDHPKLHDRLLNLYRDNPDAGIHSSVEWLLRKGGQTESLRKELREMAQDALPNDRRWHVNGQEQTFAVFRGSPQFLMGSRGQYGAKLHRRKISRDFAVAAHEITVEQFRQFKPDFQHNQMVRSPDPDCPVPGVLWYEATAYCNWLSGREGIPEDQWCYLPNDAGEFADGMKPAPDFLNRAGYRLPTEVEWEFAARGGADTPYFFGLGRDLLSGYAWCASNAKDRTWPVGRLMPNAHGLFDVYGNVREWCHDQKKDYDIKSWSYYVFDRGGTDEVKDEDNRVLRGGGFNDRDANSYARAEYLPGNRYKNSFGFRIARTLPK